ncbi:MAG: hypothetical protein NTW21_41375 [Verrucomicrobia bacterium]|nr:hypothetical protein [Verrucomicrobiota bacterium]
MSAHEPSHAPPGIPLQALVAELRSRCEAVSRLQGGATYFHEELGIFHQVANEQGLFLQAPPDVLSRIPDEEGNEHQVWYLPDTKAVLKATWPDFFGLLVMHRPNDEPKASPIAYLERWALHNELFGDNVRFLGALAADSGLRLLIQQPAIAGTPATDEEIQHFFTTSGWRRFIIDGNIAFFDPERYVVISDTHRGNLILMDDGLLAPIDLRVQPISGALLDSVTKLCTASSANY